MGETLTAADIKHFEVSYELGGLTPIEAVDACYWQLTGVGDELKFYEFKDVNHKPVFSVRADRVVTVRQVTAKSDAPQTNGR